MLLKSGGISVKVEYESIEEVTLKLPPRNESLLPETRSSNHPHSINIDEPAPKSYVCLGYTFAIVAGFCFTSWWVLN